MTTSFTDQYVTKVYDQIALHFNDTRAYIWLGVKQFIHNLPKYSRLLEVGCGNGKNLLIRNDLLQYGVDISHNMAVISDKKGVNISVASGIKLPFKDNSFDNSLSVAVIHHLASNQDRIQALQEQIRVTTPGGKIFLQVWSIHASENSKNKDKFVALNEEGDYLVKWQEINGEVYQRYYHLFTQNDFLQLLASQKQFIEESAISYERDNWIAIITLKHNLS